jgi:hypothetical protein
MPGCFKTVGITFAVLTIVLILVMFWVSHMVMRVPNLRNYAICIEQSQEIAAALNRFATKNDQYPEKLEELYPRFIEKKSVLHCPLDKSAPDAVSYEYHRPAMDAPDDTVVLICRRHVLFKGQPAVIVATRKDGTPVKPSLQPQSQGTAKKGGS